MSFNNARKIIKLNKNCHVFDSDYSRQYIPPYGLSEFYGKIGYITKNGKRIYYLFLYFVDQEFDTAYYNNDYLIGVNIKYISPNFPNRWEEDIKRALNESVYENKKMPNIMRTIDDLYQDILTLYIEINDWWIDACELSPQECRKQKKYCISLHTKFYRDYYDQSTIEYIKNNYVELLLTGYYRDMPGYPDKWKWIHLINSKEGHEDDISYLIKDIQKRKL